MIYETIVSTLGADGKVRLAPIGVRNAGDTLVIAPYAPSATLDNLRRTGEAVVNLSDDVRIFVGCLTGRRRWPLAQARLVSPPRLRDALAHLEVRVNRCEEDPIRPRFYCERLHEGQHTPFRGFNRAQAAVLEAAVLVSRLHLLPRADIESRVQVLRGALGKTAGARERLAWEWLMEKLELPSQGIDL